MKKFKNIYVGDFETTVYEKQDSTEVWASAIVELGSENVIIHHSIDELFDYLIGLKQNVLIYYHNLKFDGAFWLSFLMNKLNLPQAIDNNKKFFDTETMPNNTFCYSISHMGQWYSVDIKYKNHIIELRDSMKLLPFSVKKIGKSFKTKHQKLDMEYTGFRYAGCVITDEEKEYIKNDVLVIKEALEIMFNEKHTQLTIGACCLTEFKRILNQFSDKVYDTYFPDLTQFLIDKDIYGSENADEYIRKSYRGGWCYVARGKERKIFHNGTTADVNSLYPSMMSSESGNKYPLGKPHFWTGCIPDEAIGENKYFFVRIKTRFYIKENMLPFIQIKNSLLYSPNDMLETSDFYSHTQNKYGKYYILENGEKYDSIQTMTMTMTDYALFLDHYNTEDFEILDGCWFKSHSGIFDEYIDKYKKIKMESTGAIRELAKLFLNNLYGKMASSTNSSYKVAYLKEDKSLGYEIVIEHNKKAGFIAVGSAITSYARNFTIRTAQQNYYGKDKRGFIYADTDSIHCDLQPNELKGVPVDDKDFCKWKLESCWDVGWFVRQKTYIEHITKENLVECEPYYNVKCAGMPDRCKELFLMSVNGAEITDDMTEEEKEFLSVKRKITDFTDGLCVPDKLMPKSIRGGVLLVSTMYQMK